MTDYVAFEGAYKVITLTGAEDLGQETGNVLLKLFEEPSERTVFILTAERPGLHSPYDIFQVPVDPFRPIGA